ncbi:MAG TPA: ATP-binding protein [Trueperaceae bacterium]
MSRLSVKLMLAFVGVTLLTIALVVAPQLRGIARENVALPPEERPTLTAGSVSRAILEGRLTPSSSHEATMALLRGVEVQAGDRTLMIYVPEGAEPGRWLAAEPGGRLVMDLPARRWEELRALNALVAAGRTNRSDPGGPQADAQGGGLPSLVGGPPTSGGVLSDDEALALAEPDGDSVSRSTLLAYVRSSLERRTVALVGSAVLALALAAVLALLLARLIARPIETVTAAAGRISAGDLSARIPLGRRREGGSETARLASSFNAMADSLQRLEESRRIMVADIAHELRTPLTVMRGRLEAMEDGVADLNLEEVRDLHAQVLVLTRLVEDLRTLSLADAGRLSLHLDDVDMAEVARVAAAGHRVRADERGVTLEVDASAPAPVRADKERLLQVIGNLLDNALTHTPPGGCVALRVSQARGSVAVEVRDTGPGIPSGQEGRIFERFVRTDDARSRAKGGSGIGLAIVKTLVELHGGVVSAANAPSGGAVFRVELPA